ncbi:unnamed protein product [Didymodactylos carnosus]|uniref:Protein regulator of cytokinesis 1 n=1 Tax=Didymodactylos carnosus TaxID=1234261 RepID=A0A813RFW8_9BILA|nr:unnamed protein product [Didymodactylos carnosus]CAF3565318.1 unnamed protein product [Didymodactylos carnosus]
MTLETRDQKTNFITLVNLTWTQLSQTLIDIGYNDVQQTQETKLFIDDTRLFFQDRLKIFQEKRKELDVRITELINQMKTLLFVLNEPEPKILTQILKLPLPIREEQLHKLIEDLKNVRNDREKKLKMLCTTMAYQSNALGIPFDPKYQDIEQLSQQLVHEFEVITSNMGIRLLSLKQHLKDLSEKLLELSGVDTNKTELDDLVQQFLKISDFTTLNEEIPNGVELKEQLSLLYDRLKQEHDRRMKELQTLHLNLIHLYKVCGIDIKDTPFAEIGIPTQQRLSTIQSEIEETVNKIELLKKEIKIIYQSVLQMRKELDENGKWLTQQESTLIVELLNLSDIFLWNKDHPSLPQLNEKLQKEYVNLMEEKERRIKMKDRYLNGIKRLWARMNLSENDEFRMMFSSKLNKIENHNSLEVVELCKKEYERLSAFRKDQIQALLLQTKTKLNQLWNEIEVPEIDRQLFLTQGMNDDDEQLLIMEEEIERLEKYIASIRQILTKIQKREWYKHEMIEFEKIAGEPNRLKGSSIQLIKEEKFRKDLAKEFPKLTEDLRTMIADWERNDSKKRLFFRGEPYLSILNAETFSPDFELLHLKLLTKPLLDRANSVLSETDSFTTAPIQAKKRMSASQPRTQPVTLKPTGKTIQKSSVYSENTTKKVDSRPSTATSKETPSSSRTSSARSSLIDSVHVPLNNVLLSSTLSSIGKTKIPLPSKLVKQRTLPS